MGITELFILALGLAMDAFAVSICKGLSSRNVELKKSLITGLWFGGFQALMPVIGYFIGSAFQKYITAFDHWIAFILLALIGGNMIKESFSKEEKETSASFGIKAMLPMAVATSIDALAIGVTFAFLNVDIFAAASLIGIITFALSAVGVYIGNAFGGKYKSKAELAGGIVLILLGLKILLEHLGVI